jgi:hypothetical protein
MEASITARLDPRIVYPYICEAERGKEDYTTFYLKSLTVLEYRECEEISLNGSRQGHFSLKVLKYGLTGWDNFTYTDGKVIPFSFKNFNAIPPIVQPELVTRVIELSEPDEDMIEDLRHVTRWFNIFDRMPTNQRDQWSCIYCAEKKLTDKRNCTGSLPYMCNGCHVYFPHNGECKKCRKTLKPRVIYRYSNKVGDYSSQCPIALLNQEAIKLTNIIHYIDNSKALPFPGGALEQTNFFYNTRLIVLSEQNAVMKEELEEIRKSKDGRHGK